MPCYILQEEVMVLERILLQTIKFDLQVEHPYQFLLKYAKQLKGKILQGEAVMPVINFQNLVYTSSARVFYSKLFVLPNNFIPNNFSGCFSGDKNKIQKLVQMAWTFVNDR